MSMMGLPLQAHTNVRDVLAPLFCNGRSFASLIDELSRHFKFEQISSDAAHDDTTGALEASSESQSTDSEAEGNASDEADGRLIQARVSAQARSQKQRASKGAATPPPFSTTPDPPPLDFSATFAAAATAGPSRSTERHGDVSSSGVRGRVTTPVAAPAPTSAPMGGALPSTRRTRSRSRQQQQQQHQKQTQQKQRQQQQKKQKQQQQQQQQQAEPSPASTPAPPSDEAGGRRVTRGNATTTTTTTTTTTAPPTATATTPTPPPPTTTITGSGIGTNNVSASAAIGTATSTTSGSTGGAGGGAGGRSQEGAEGTFFRRDAPTPTGASQGEVAPVGGGGAAASASAAPLGASGASAGVGNGSGSSTGSSSSSGAVGAGINSKGFISGNVLTVLSVTANADGWSEAVGAALATRARAGYVFAQEVNPDSPQSTEFVREVFLDERSGARKALEVRMRLIPVSQKVLLCSAWVDSGEYLAAAAKLVAKCQAEVFGIACVRFEQNRSTEGLVDRFNLYAKSMPKGSVPSLNVGMKSCIPASLTKGFHGYTYNQTVKGSGVWDALSSTGSKLGSSGADGGGEKASGVGGASLGGGRGSPAPAAGAEVRHDRARKRRRSSCAGVSRSADAAGGRSPPVSPELAAAEAAAAAAAEAAAAAAAVATAAAVPTLEPMGDEKGGLPAGAAADEVSAGEEVTEPGDGGQPAQRFGGGGVSEGTGGGGAGVIGGVCGGVEGGRGWGRLLGGGSAMFAEEEGDYAADSERSTDHESMHLCGGGGLRESDEHDTSEREGFRRSTMGVGGAVAGLGADGVVGRQDRGRNSTRTAGYRIGGVRPESRTSSPEAGLGADGGNSSGRNSTSAGDEGSSRVGTSVLKRRRVGSASSSGGSDDGGSGDGVRGGSAVQEQTGGQGESHAHGEASRAVVGVGGIGGGEEMEEEEEDEERERDEAGVEAVETRALAVGGLAVGMGTTGTPLEWKAKLGRQPIFMSRGIPEKGGGLLSHSEGETHGTRSPGRGGIGALSGPVQDPEDDRDRASSCSSADSPVPSSIRAGGSIIVRPGSRGGGRPSVGSAGAVADDGRGIRPDTAAAIGRGVVAAAAMAAAAAAAAEVEAPRVAKAPLPNTPGGAVPWHHTSVYEANDPTEDRHAEATHSALGVRIYCVCDGHGGSRAAQFVCDHLAGDVLARVVAMAATARERGGPGSGEEWTGNEQEVRRLLADAFTSCDEQFIAQLDPRKNRGYINAGCCVLLALLIRSKLYVAHVGDCRIVLGTTDAGPARFPPNFLSTASTTVTAHGAVAAALGAAGGGNGRDGAAFGRESGGVRGGSVTPPGGRRAGYPTRSSPGGGLGAVALSRDHNCDDADEVALVRARSGDEKAIRVSRNDQYKGARAIKRVAGSLAVTRAVGDAYLKKAAFSFTPYKEGVPYITAEPAVTSLDLTSSDRFLVLATDGVWEQVSNEEAVRCVTASLGSLGSGGDGGGGGAGATPSGSSPAMSRRQRGATGRAPVEGGWGGAVGDGAAAGAATAAATAATSDALVDFVLARSAQGHGMSVSSLRALPRGPPRRMLHDDVCATVVHLTPAQRQ